MAADPKEGAEVLPVVAYIQASFSLEEGRLEELVLPHDKDDELEGGLYQYVPLTSHAAATSLIAELQRELAETAGDHLTSLGVIDRLRAELAEVKRDAERYRWLRDPANQEAPRMVNYYSPCGLDAAIDAALAKESP